MEKELELLEELLAERETLLKIGEGRLSDGILSEDALKKIAEERESLIRIAKIVNAEAHALSENDRKTLAVVAERLIKESASAYIKSDAGDEGVLRIFDNIEKRNVAEFTVLRRNKYIFITKCQFF